MRRNVRATRHLLRRRDDGERDGFTAKTFAADTSAVTWKIGAVRKIGFRVAVSGAIARPIYTIDYSGSESTANSPVEASDHVPISSDRA